MLHAFKFIVKIIPGNLEEHHRGSYWGPREPNFEDWCPRRAKASKKNFEETRSSKWIIILENLIPREFFFRGFRSSRLNFLGLGPRGFNVLGLGSSEEPSHRELFLFLEEQKLRDVNTRFFSRLFSSRWNFPTRKSIIFPKIFGN